MSLIPEPHHSYQVRSGLGPFKMRVLEVGTGLVRGVITDAPWYWPGSVVKLGNTIVVRMCNASFTKAR